MVVVSWKTSRRDRQALSHTRTRTHPHTHTHEIVKHSLTRMHTHTHTHTHEIVKHSHTHTHTHTHTRSSSTHSHAHAHIQWHNYNLTDTLGNGSSDKTQCRVPKNAKLVLLREKLTRTERTCSRVIMMKVLGTERDSWVRLAREVTNS